MNFHNKHKQVAAQPDARVTDQQQDVAASSPLNNSPNSQVASQKIKCSSPMTFSQKLYQSHELEIAEEFERALSANYLEGIKKILDKVLEL